MINPGEKDGGPPWEIPPGDGRRGGWENENRHKTGWWEGWEAILAGQMAAAGGIFRKIFQVNKVITQCLFLLAVTLFLWVEKPREIPRTNS